jgi:uncharacterized protein
MDFKEALEKLFLRNVNLIEMQTLKNPILRQSINRKKMALYERADSEMAVISKHIPLLKEEVNKLINEAT